MVSELKELIDKFLDDFILDLNLKLVDFRTKENGNMTIAVYEASGFKLYFYESLREGEINCLVGKTYADIQDTNDGNWFYVNAILSKGSQLSVEELLKNVPDEPRSIETQFSDLASNIRCNIKKLAEYVSE
ncbi:MAG: hypothetical protein HKN34_11355 [Gammaproteobacteria bacterium]|nr:hypothetical protein [Gammaproteobacteria bacterium]